MLKKSIHQALRSKGSSELVNFKRLDYLNVEETEKKEVRCRSETLGIFKFERPAIVTRMTIELRLAVA